MLMLNWHRKRKLKVTDFPLLAALIGSFFVPIEESLWIEVLIDILLSMDTKKQHDIRSIVKKIYHQIVPHVNENALKLMLQVGIVVLHDLLRSGNFRQLHRKMKAMTKVMKPVTTMKKEEKKMMTTTKVMIKDQTTKRRRMSTKKKKI